MQQPFDSLTSAHPEARSKPPESSGSTPPRAHTLTKSTTYSTSTYDYGSPSAAAEAAVRERRRVNKARSRKKLRDTAANHEKDIWILQEKIRELELYRQLVVANVPTKTTSWNVVAEYFRLFRHGFNAPAPISSQDSYVHLDFLRATMAPDVVTDSTRGVHEMLEYWRLLSLCCPEMDMRPVQLKDGAGGSIVAIFSSKFTMTERTLWHAFPQLEYDGEEGKCSTLASILVGQEIVVEGLLRFDWDDESARVTRMFYNSDLLTPILRLLGNLDDVGRMFQGALLTPDGKLSGFHA